MIFIGISEVLDNAFYIYVKRTNKRAISMEKLNNYAHSVVRTLQRRNIQTILLFSKERFDKFFNVYTDIYKRVNTEEDTIIVLDEEANVDNLNNKYSNYPIRPLMDALRSEENIRELF